MSCHPGVLCLLLLMWPASGLAQRGSISGSVVDQTGLVLPGTTVTLRGVGGPRTVSSGEQGRFELISITPSRSTSLATYSGGPWWVRLNSRSNASRQCGW